MALIEGTNSYTTASFADTYLAEVGKNTVWDTKTAGEKETALILATEYMEGKYSNQWTGYITSLTQALAFPRNGLVDNDGRIYTDGITPDQIKKGCALFAEKTLSEELEETELAKGTVYEEEIAGVVKEKRVQSYEKQKRYPQIEALFKRFLYNHNDSIISLSK